MSTKIKSFGDMLTEIELTIEDWGSKARGGDEFFEYVPTGVFQGTDFLGQPVEVTEKLPICLVGTVSYGVTEGTEFYGYNMTRDIPDFGEREQARLFLDELIRNVDFDKTYNWQRAYDKTLKQWGLS